MTAKNTFGEGLIMDFAPDNTQASVLSNALNATLLTFNGNEMSLQNDMGNGRVETARLPEGYIPVGSCEFGDIIYIVSYNPITNKSQIGCFPSPERNISSEEIGGTNQTISAEDFQKYKDGNLTGELKANSKKIILYNRTMNPGDKFIIYDQQTNPSINNTCLSDYGSEVHEYGSIPRFLKLHVVSIEDSGKITYLDTSVKWYNNDYYITNKSTNTATNKIDIDEYRNLLESGYSVFQSKVSGKLGILAELEKIDGFSCTYSIYANDQKSEEEDQLSDKTINKTYKVLLELNWDNDTNVNINPAYVVLTESEWNDSSIKNIQTNYKVADKDANKQDISSIPVDSITLPKAYPDTNYWYKVLADYKEYNEPTYAEYRNVCYEAKEKNFLKNKGYTSIVYAADDNGIPKPGEYLITKYGDIIKTKSTKITRYQGAISSRIDQIINQKPTISEVVQKPIQEKPGVIEGEVGDIGDKDIMLTSEGDYTGVTEQNPSSTTGVSSGVENTESSANTETTEFTNIDSSIIDAFGNKVKPQTIDDAIVNNYYHKGIFKELGDFTIPIEYRKYNEGKSTQIFSYDRQGLVYHYQVTPAMYYGLLREYSIDGYIDFSKVGTGDISIKKWKYYNMNDLSTLTFGVDIYPEPNKGVSEIVLEFYDNQENMAAAYHISGRSSYSGTFTESIPLNGSAQSYKLNGIDATGTKSQHKGLEIDENSYNAQPDLYIKEEVKDDKGELKETHYYQNDAGTLYSGIVYLVKIVVKYSNKSALGDYIEQEDYEKTTYYRWFWTNSLYNERYFDTDDYDVLPFQLTLDVTPQYNQGDDYNYKSFDYSPDTNSLVKADNLSSTVQSITGTLQLQVYPSIQNQYNTFMLTNDCIKYVKAQLFDGDTTVVNYPEKPNSVHTSTQYSSELDGLFPNCGIYDPDLKYGNKLLSKLDKNTNSTSFEEIYENYKNYKNTGLIVLTPYKNIEIYSGDDLYITSEGESHSLKDLKYFDAELSTLTETNAYSISLDLIHFSNYYKEVGSGVSTVKTLKPIVANKNDLANYGLSYHEDGHIYVNTLVVLGSEYSNRHREGDNYQTEFNFIPVSLPSTSSEFNISSVNVDEYFSSGSQDQGSVISVFNGNYQTTNTKRAGSIADYTDKVVEFKNKFTLNLWRYTDFSYTQSSSLTSAPPKDSFMYYLNQNQCFNDTTKGFGEYCYKGTGNKRLVTLAYAGDSVGQYHLLNTGFLVNKNEGSESIKQTTTLYKAVPKTVNNQYYVGDGYDYYLIKAERYNEQKMFKLIVEQIKQPKTIYPQSGTDLTSVCRTKANKYQNLGDIEVDVIYHMWGNECQAGTECSEKNGRTESASHARKLQRHIYKGQSSF